MPLRRRQTLLLLLAAPAVPAALARPARAASPEQAAAFIKRTGDALVAVVNGPGSAAAKEQKLAAIIDAAVAVDRIGRFVLGQFWRIATAQERDQYLALFRQLIVFNITGQINAYKGVTFTLGRAVPRDAEDIFVATTVTRPGQPPTEVQWDVNSAGGTLKILDVVVAGTSLRQTQRSEYASVITRNGVTIPPLLAAMKTQLARLRAAASG
ncbi:MAG: MlaC/ttg2D family ABC transporter substrate-binding protein [Acetobacteraceae bacterium]